MTTKSSREIASVPGVTVSGSFWSRVGRLPLCRSVVVVYGSTKVSCGVAGHGLSVIESGVTAVLPAVCTLAAACPGAEYMNWMANKALDKLEGTVDTLSKPPVQMANEAAHRCVRAALKTYPGRLSVRVLDNLIKRTNDFVEVKVGAQHGGENEATGNTDESTPATDSTEGQVTKTGPKTSARRLLMTSLEFMLMVIMKTRNAIIQVSGIGGCPSATKKMRKVDSAVDVDNDIVDEVHPEWQSLEAMLAMLDHYDSDNDPDYTPFDDKGSHHDSLEYDSGADEEDVSHDAIDPSAIVSSPRKRRAPKTRSSPKKEIPNELTPAENTGETSEEEGVVATDTVTIEADATDAVVAEIDATDAVVAEADAMEAFVAEDAATESVAALNMKGWLPLPL